MKIRHILAAAILNLSYANAADALVANIETSHGVSQSGAATYSIPIECPEGINGLTPNISIEYNSQAGNGLLGLGWNIGGLSAFTRVPKDMYHDGGVYPLDWWNAVLSLDGNRLMADLLEKEEDVQIKYIGDSGHDLNIEVRKKNGEVWEYGKTSAACHALTNEGEDGQSSLFKGISYQLNKITDANGNYITFSYAHDKSSLTDEGINNLPDETGSYGRRGLKYNYYINNRISYVSYGSNVNGGQLAYQICFDYEDRPDDIRTYIANYMNRQQKRLKAIRVILKENGVIKKYRTYNFVYQTTAEEKVSDPYYGFSKLKQIDICGEDNVSLGAVKVAWETTSGNAAIKETACGSLKSELPYSNKPTDKRDGYWCNQNYHMNAVPLDYNNDGLSDLILTDDVNSALAVKFYMAVKDASGNVRFNEDAQNNYYIFDHRFSILTGHFESVSKPTVLVRRQGTQHPNFYYFNKIETEAKNINSLKENETEAYYWFGLSEGGITTWPVDWEQRPFFCTVADVNNDGFDDIVILERAPKGHGMGYTDGCEGKGDYALRICYGGESKGRAIKRTLSLNEFPLEFFVFDMDGDKLKDLVILNRKGLTVYKNMGTASVNTSFECKVSDGYSEVFQKYAYQQPGENRNSQNKNYWKICYDIVRPSDFNGDGLTDLLVYRDDVGGGILYNDGHYGFEDAETIDNLNPFYCKLYGPVGEAGYKYNLSIYDIDGNGLSDICVQNGENAYLLKARKDISGNKQVVFDKEEFSLPNYWTNRISSPVSDFDGDGRMEMMTVSRIDEITLHTTSAPYSSGKVSSITDPLGNKCEFTYKPLTDASIYTYDESWNNDAELLSEYPVPLGVVSEMKYKSSGPSVVTKERKTYKYEGALRHSQGKGFLGFRKMTVTDEQSGFVTVSENAYDSRHKVLYPSKETVALKDGTPVRTTENISKIIPLDGLRYRLTDGDRVETDHQTGVVTRTATVIDQHGNILETTVNNGMTTETVQFSDYVGNGSWCAHLPGKKTVTRTSGGDTHAQTTLYEYDGRGNLTKETINPNTDLQLANAYEYDQFGNCTKQSSTGGGRTLTRRYWYDANGHHLTKMTDECGMTTEYAYAMSHLVRQTDRYGVTNITNDALGRPVKTELPNGTVQTVTYKKSPFYMISHMRTVETTGKPTQKTVYNSFGEIIADAETLPNGSTEYFVKTIRLYDGRISNVSSPFKAPASSAQTLSGGTNQEKYTYDKFLRPVTVQKAVTSTSTLQQTDITYDKLRMKSVSPEETVEVQYDAAGRKAWVTTNGKRVDFTYYANGQIKTATPQGGTPVTFEYDINGNQTKMVSDEETISSVYDAFGNVTRTTQDVHRSGQHIVTEYTYNAKNLLVKTDLNGEVTTYSYDDKSRLYLVTSSNGHQIKYEYNIFDWLLKKTETIDGKDYVYQYEYDAAGNLVKETYPSGYSVLNTYNEYGYLQKVESSDGTPIWAFNSCDTYGRISSEKIGNTNKSTSYAPGGMVTYEYAGGLFYFNYDFAENKTLMSCRKEYYSGQQEKFAYDSQNRLTSWNVYDMNNNLRQKNGFSYNAAGDIALITATGEELAYGEYGYPKHAVTSVTAEPDTEKPMQEITYTDFKKVKTIAEGGKRYELFYGADLERRKSVFTDGEKTKTKIYLGNYEKETDSFGAERNLHYICGANGLAAIYVTTADKDTMYYAFTDYQHNLLALTDAAGKPYERYS
ncbi:MAG: FG-GAP-like repeat-containing protein, partial [Bacteroidales bacterium]|nr:FG-GAP-like repeat-containing protein [Bacteroidales bacterium]